MHQAFPLIAVSEFIYTERKIIASTEFVPALVKHHDEKNVFKDYISLIITVPASANNLF